MAKCKVCNAPHRSCGPRITVIPVDERIKTREQGDMSLQRYTITSGRRGEHTVTVKLSEAEAKRLGVFDEKSTASASTGDGKTAAPKNTRKARTPRNKAAKAAAKTAPAGTGAVEEASDPDASEA